jgi:hypothetical protein
MYKVDDMAGRRPLRLSVEGTVGAEGQQYFVALANYTQGRWQWFGPGTASPFDIALGENRDRYVSRAGNLYFLVVAHGGNSVLHAQTTLTIGLADQHDHPGFPVQLRASDGTLPAAINVEWMAGEGATSFELMRAEQPFPNQRPQWETITETTEESFVDSSVIPDKVYLYRVQATNEAGRSCFSNVDPGFAGEVQPPQEFNGEVRGRVVQGDSEQGVPGIFCALLGASNVEQLSFVTNEQGEFGFNHLPPGHYIVFAQNPDQEFEPRFLNVEVNPEHPIAQALFHTRPGEHKHALWGFVYAMGGPEAPGLHPLGNVPVKVKLLGSPDPPVEVRSDPMGFWMATELVSGEYDVRPVQPGVNFNPLSRVGHIDGVHVTPALNFRAGPPPSGGGDPGEGGGGDPGEGGGGGEQP